RRTRGGGLRDGICVPQRSRRHGFRVARGIREPCPGDPGRIERRGESDVRHWRAPRQYPCAAIDRLIAALRRRLAVAAPGPPTIKSDDHERPCPAGRATVIPHEQQPMNPQSRAAMAPVPPTRIDFSEADREWIAERIKEVLITGRLTLGPYGEAFEERFAAFVGAKHAIAISNGTAALEFVLRPLGVAGRVVLVPATTFSAPAAAVINAGARPVLMDTDLRTLSTAAAEIERRLTTNTAGAVIVHIGGAVTDELPAIVDFLAERRLWLGEDAPPGPGSPP